MKALLALLAHWPPRDWRMLLALLLIGVSGAGAWLLNRDVLHHLAELADRKGEVWPLAYYAFGALAVLGLTSIACLLVLGMRSFRADLPGGTSVTLDCDTDEDPR